MIKNEIFGTTSEGKIVERFVLSNTNGMEVAIITYGGRIQSLKVPDKNGKFENVVAGFDSLENYSNENPYFGAIIGRYGNRIAKGKFTLDGMDYQLMQNNGGNSLHGGEKGFDSVIWHAEVVQTSNLLKLRYTSSDGEEGFPGNLSVIVTYTLKENNSLDICYQAWTDKKTIINLTNHSYFNLRGNFSEKFDDYRIKINADNFIPINEKLIPAGEIRKVNDTPFDFRNEKTVSPAIEQVDKQLSLANGFDHCWVLNDQKRGMRFAASASDSKSGRSLEVYTDEPGVQFYTGNFLDGTLSNAKGEIFTKRSAFCFETQHYPDSPNQKNFPSVVLSPNEQYNSNTTFKFTLE